MGVGEAFSLRGFISRGFISRYFSPVTLQNMLDLDLASDSETNKIRNYFSLYLYIYLLYSVKINYNDVRILSIESVKKTKVPSGLY